MKDILLPISIKEDELKDISDDHFKLKYRAIAVRHALELLLEHVFLTYLNKFDKKINPKKWGEKTIHQKIEYLPISLFGKELKKQLRFLKDVGNSGAHKRLEHKLTHEKLKNSFNILSKLSEKLLIQYFKTNSFNSSQNVATPFSCLEPKYRCSVLERHLLFLLEYDFDAESAIEYYSRYINLYNSNTEPTVRVESLLPNPLRLQPFIDLSLKEEFMASENLMKYEELLLVVDKLSMAYVKNNSLFLGLCTVHRVYSMGLLHYEFYEALYDKLHRLAKRRDSLPIAKDQNESIEVLQEIKNDPNSNDINLGFVALIQSMLQV